MNPEPRPDPDNSTRAPPSTRAAGRLKRRLLFLAGWLFVAIGIVGIVLPGLPGTVFLILAAWCFARSSPRFERWLLDHPRLGPPVRRWRESGAIPPAAKGIACASLALSWTILFATLPRTDAAVALAVLFVAVAAYIVTRPNA
jgi:uncharacterized protein